MKLPDLSKLAVAVTEAGFEELATVSRSEPVVPAPVDGEENTAWYATRLRETIEKTRNEEGDGEHVRLLGRMLQTEAYQEAVQESSVPIRAAIASGQADVVRALCAIGADVNARNEHDETALVELLAGGAGGSAAALATASEVLKQGGDVVTATAPGNGQSLIVSAVRLGSPRLVQMLMDRSMGAQLWELDRNGVAVADAVLQPEPMLELLMRMGGNPDGITRYDDIEPHAWTDDELLRRGEPLRAACTRGLMRQASLLIAAGATTHGLPDSKGRSFLHLAIDGGHADVAMLLLNNWGWRDVLSRDAEGRTPHEAATACGMEELAAAIQAHLEEYGGESVRSPTCVLDMES